MNINKPKAKKRQKRGLETEKKVPLAAERLLREEGFDAAQIDKIAKESGVSVGSLYHHFGSKEGVIRRLIERFCEEGRQAVDELDLADATIDQALMGILRAGMGRFRKNPELYRTMAARMEKEPEIWQPMRNLRGHYEDRLVAELGDELAGRGLTAPRRAIARMMQAVLALMTHIVIFSSGPVGLKGEDSEREIFDMAKAILELEIKRNTAGKQV